jgi:nucleoside-diphosphate-sugar epimerase
MNSTSALLIGGTGFTGRSTVDEFLEHGYDATTVARGEQDEPHADHGSVAHRRGDRNDRATLGTVRDEAAPDVVVDLCGYAPRQAEAATEVFADVDAYVFVSSAAAYDTDRLRLPSREGDPLEECTPEQTADDSMATYGPRKAECDRVCFAAAEAGVNALVARPVCVYGPHDHTERHDYRFHRVNAYDRILVSGDGDGTFHRVYVEDLARALRVVAERGEPGEAYNAAERRTAWLDRTLRLAAAELDAEVELVHTSARELARGGLSPTDFPLYFPVPAVVASETLAALGWDSTPLAETSTPTVEEHLESDRRGEDPAFGAFGVDRETEVALVEELTGEAEGSGGGG